MISIEELGRGQTSRSSHSIVMIQPGATDSSHCVNTRYEIVSVSEYSYLPNTESDDL